MKINVLRNDTVLAQICVKVDMDEFGIQRQQCLM